MSASPAVLLFPEALNQQGGGPFLGTLGVMRVMSFATFLAVMVYLTAFVVLWILTRFFARRSLRTLHRASSVFGVAILCFVATMYCAFIIPGTIGEIIEGCLMIAVWVPLSYFPFASYGREIYRRRRTQFP